MSWQALEIHGKLMNLVYTRFAGREDKANFSRLLFRIEMHIWVRWSEEAKKVSF
jgi:hypothetical protein